MRKKVPKLIVSFKSSTAAMEMESIARPGLGRIIPLPAKINAGCGLAFCADLHNEREIVQMLTKSGIEHNGIHIVELFETGLSSGQKQRINCPVRHP